ncbi:hypothetical protein [Candidatus Nitrososphaera sp. FF02]|uniref:hypothetical protein n=1 Tax=Candidatus Nitrososphaera sp. FF02 TaxID=3398226 RepID=UPI0039ED7E3A
MPDKSRRGVGGIIAGVILMAIIFTSVLVFFVTINNNDRARFGYEKASQEEEKEKAIEDFGVRDSSTTSSTVTVVVENTGPIPMRASQMLAYCVSGPDCTNPEVPSTTDISVTLNPGDSTTENIAVSSGNVYRVDVISERGNIETFSCDFDVDECVVLEDDIEDEIEGAVNEGIVQGTGSLQLDFNSFGLLLPDLTSRTDDLLQGLGQSAVDQRGFEVVVSSRYGSATGYPAFDIPGGLEAVLVEKVRNLDPNGEDLRLTRYTGLQVLSGIQGSQPDTVFICMRSGTSFTAYNEQTNYQIIANTEITAPRTEGWHELYFCSTDPSSTQSSDPWVVEASTSKFSPMNGILMIAKGTFEDSQAGYGQTVPYQAISVGVPGSSNFYACLLEANTNTSCTGPSANQSGANISASKYSDTVANIQAGSSAYAHLMISGNPAPQGPFEVAWHFPDGTRETVAAGGVNGFNNIQFPIPDEMPDGSAIEPGYYTVSVADSYGSYDSSLKAFTKNVYYMTFRVVS